MSAIVIKADTKSNKILLELAKRMGANAFSVKDEQYEDFSLGTLMDSGKTNDTVSREEIIEKLRK